MTGTLRSLIGEWSERRAVWIVRRRGETTIREIDSLYGKLRESWRHCSSPWGVSKGSSM